MHLYETAVHRANRTYTRMGYGELARERVETGLGDGRTEVSRGLLQDRMLLRRVTSRRGVEPLEEI